MNIVRSIAATLISLSFAVQANAVSTKDGKTKQISFFKSSKEVLKTENIALKQDLDSLKAELERYKEELKRTDSLTNEILNSYQSNADVPEDTAAFEYSLEASDSLLNAWYQFISSTETDMSIEMNDSLKYISNIPDSVYMERIKRMNSFITLPYNDIVKSHIIKYSEKMPGTMGRILGLCEHYMPIFQETFDRYGIPEELMAMAIIESALNPRAESRVGAKGMWQFMYSTGKLYGLHIDSFVDERMDPVKSADAAARYLLDSYKILGDWNLAIASYNCGIGNVNKAIKRSGSRNFWDLWPYLPRETRGYGPAFVGALYTMKFYKEHGIKPVPSVLPPVVDTFQIKKMLHLKQVSELTGAPLDVLKELNPQYKHLIIPGNEREYVLRIPFQYTNAFLEAEDSLYMHKSSEYFNPMTIKKIKEGGDGVRIIHKVKSGEVLGKIAAQYRCSVSQIKKWNNLKSDNIRVGQSLVIYRGGRAPASASTATKSTSTKQTTGSAPKTVKSSSGDYVIYTVQPNDTFYSIAKKYPGISAQNIMDYNGLSSSNIRPGMKIKIPLKL